MRIAARGQGHQPYGQAQVSDGLVVDLRPLRTAGWVSRSLVQQAAAAKRAIPVLPNYLGLTLGGTISVGGLGISSLHFGSQADQVRELQVVTGEGELITCSESQHRELFEAALVGQGQCAIIVRATLRLIAAQPMVREHVLPYRDVNVLLDDLASADRVGRFQGAVAVLESADGGWKFAAVLNREFTPPAMPDNAPLLAGLHYERGQETVRDVEYAQYVDQIPGFEFTEAHTDLSLFIPGSFEKEFFRQVLPRLTANDLGTAMRIRLFSWKRERFTRPLLCLPDHERLLYVAILRTPTSEKPVIDRMIAGNRVLFELARDAGGTLYPFSALEMSRQDWERHYGDQCPGC